MRITGALSQVDPLGTIPQDGFCLYHSLHCTLVRGAGERAFTHSGPLVLLREKMHMDDLSKGRHWEHLPAWFWLALLLGRGKPRDTLSLGAGGDDMPSTTHPWPGI